MFEAGMVQTLVEGVRDTLYMVLASTAFGYLLGLPLGILLCTYRRYKCCYTCTYILSHNNRNCCRIVNRTCYT